MTKIDEIKNDLLGDYIGDHDFPPDYHYEKGFDACMELELPVKFAWFIGAYDDITACMQDCMCNDERELFTYWLNNVYNKEVK